MALNCSDHRLGAVGDRRERPLQLLDALVQRASLAHFRSRLRVEVRVDTYNVGVDFISGMSTPIVRAYQLCEGLEPTILGTSGNDILVGTPGRDVIHGLGGRDLIDGKGGEDVICRGEDLLPTSIGYSFLSFAGID